MLKNIPACSLNLDLEKLSLLWVLTRLLGAAILCFMSWFSWQARNIVKYHDNTSHNSSGIFREDDVQNKQDLLSRHGIDRIAQPPSASASWRPAALTVIFVSVDGSAIAWHCGASVSHCDASLIWTAVSFHDSGCGLYCLDAGRGLRQRPHPARHATPDGLTWRSEPLHESSHTLLQVS